MNFSCKRIRPSRFAPLVREVPAWHPLLWICNSWFGCLLNYHLIGSLVVRSVSNICYSCNVRSNLFVMVRCMVPRRPSSSTATGKRLVFVTNNSTKSRKQYGKKFETLGLSVDEEEIFASSFAAAAYLQSIDFPKDKKVYVIGEEGILKELELAGFQYLGGPTDGDKKIELKPGFYMEHDKDVGAVVVGFDRYFNYYKVQYGTLCIRENPGCLFIATNRDAVTHLTDAQEWAGGGSMVGAILGSTKQEPLVVGKPSTFMMDYLAKKFGITTSQICMVGDRLDTDILFGQNGGCKTLLVLSGVTSLQTLQSPDNSIQPDFYTNQISDFLTLKAATI